MRMMSFLFSLVLPAGLASAADSLHIRIVGQYDMPGRVYGVDAVGDFAYAVDTDGLHVIRVADPANPCEIGFCHIDGDTRAVTVAGDLAYVADGLDTLLLIISIVDPTNPVEVGRCRTRAGPVALTIRGDYVYAAVASGMEVFSVADPADPYSVGYCYMPGGIYTYTYNLRLDRDYAYVTDRDGGLVVVSVADPANPVRVGCYAPGGVMAVAVRDGYAYTGGYDSMFHVLSISDPTNPVELGSYAPNDVAQDVELLRGYAFAGMWNGLRVVSIADPTNPVEVGRYLRGQCFSVDMDRDYAYVAAYKALVVFQFYQPGDLDIDNDSLDVVFDTLWLRRWVTVPSSSFRRSDRVAIGGISTGKPLDSHGSLGVTKVAGGQFDCAYGEFVLANTSATYNPDSIDGPSVSPVDSVSITGSLVGLGGTIGSIVIPNLPSSLAQGLTMVCTLAAYMPPGLRDGDYSGSILVSGKDTAGLWVYESCYVYLQKLGDIDVDNDSLDVVADTIRVRIPDNSDCAVGAFVLVNTSASYNPDTADGPSRSRVETLSFTGSLTGPAGTLDSILIPNLPASVAQGQSVTCTLTVYMPDSLPAGDYSGTMVITGCDSLGCPLAETVYALLQKVPTAVGDLDVDDDSLDLVHDTMEVRAQPGYVPSGTARFMVVNTTGSYNPDTSDGPSDSPLSQVRAELRLAAPGVPLESAWVLNLPGALAVGQAVECTLALVLSSGATPEDYGGWVFISATDSLGFQVQDSFAVVVKGAEPHQNLDSFRVVPIPFKPNQNPEHDAIHFQGLTSGARVVVYDASGQSVWTATESGDGHLAWKAEVASGIYVYLVVTADGKASKVGKLSVIR